MMITLQSNPEAIPFLGATAVAGMLSIWAWTRRTAPTAPNFAAMMAGEAAWACCEAAELLVADLPIKLLCFKLRVAAAVITILALVTFVVRHTNRARWIESWRRWCLFAPALLLPLLAWAFPGSDLYWRWLVNAEINGRRIAIPSYGPAFWLHFGYCYALLGLAAALLYRERSRARGPYRAQASLMLLGILLPWVVNAIDLSRVFGFIHVDAVALAFGVTGLAMIPALRRYRLLDLIPVARSSVVQAMVDPVIVVDPQGRIVDLNDAAERLLERPPDELIGSPVTEAFGRWPALLRGLERAEAGGEPAFELRDPDTVEGRSYHARISWLSENGRQSCRVVVLRDITDRRQWELDRIERLEAVAATQAKDQFLGILSHELRTPLTPLLAVTHELTSDPETPDALRARLALVNRNLSLVSRLIDDLLDLTRIRNGKLALAPEVADAHELIRSALEMCEADLRAKGQNLRLELAAASHHVVFDPARLQQVVWNLVKNAVKFTPEGGWIKVGSREVPPADPGGRPRFLLEVSDSGIGIAPDALDRVFAAFEQGNEETTRRYGGLGLGLAISRSIVEAGGGRLRGTSEGVGRGASFTVELETVAEPASASPVSPVRATNGRRLRILLVEDHADTRRAMSRMLRSVGFDVSTAADIAEALEIASGADFDVMLCDIGLPDGSGLDLMRQIASVARRPVVGVALSGYGSDEDVRRSHQAGFALHLTKPVDFRRLEASIREAFESSASRGPAAV